MVPPSKKRRDDAADERRQKIADNRLIEQKWNERADEAERGAAEHDQQQGGE